MVTNKRIVFIGGSSGIGYEAAKLTLEKGAEVIIASRSEKKLNQAKDSLQGRVTIYTLDVTDEIQVKTFFEKIGQIDHLVITAAETSSGLFLETEVDVTRQLFNNKFWGQYLCVKYGAPHLTKGGSITLFSGIVAYKAMVGSAVLGSVNAAVASLGQTLALELAPIRVNVISPGIIDTPSRSKMSDEARNQFYEGIASKLPVEKVGKAKDVAEGVYYLIKNQFVTGTVLHIDGGHMLI